MTVSLKNLMHNHTIRWTFASLLLVFLFGLGPAASYAQEEGGNSSAEQEKLKQLKAAFATGKKAAQANNHEEAYSSLGQALDLAVELEQSGAENQIRQKLLQPLSKKWGNEAIDNEEYEDARNHFDRGIEYAENDPYMYYGKGLALINLDSLDSGLDLLQQAIEVGEQEGNSRVTELATERIQDEFLAKASEALSGENPTSAQADTALSAIDRLEEYVEPNANAFFYRGRAYFEKGEYENAISAAEEGLALHQGSRSDAAKFHFIVAESELNLGNTETACATFPDAAYGDYKARAEHYLENECE